VERVALAAGHKGLAVDWVDVDPRDRSPVRAVSGQALVPVVEADGQVLADSPVILAWLEERYPDPPLYPVDPARRAEVETFLDWFNKLWKRPPNLLAAELEQAEPDAARVAELGGRLAASLDRFEALLAGREHLLGAFGVADVTAFPFLKFGLFGLPDGDDELFHRVLVDHLGVARHPRLAAWVERVDARPRA
ncbi:MAG TPA: glutathione S-transferase family protein, partial [Gaiellaceae bacterium]|nr:glutathione S-transferase family protein [Gaiellaceae bacterium]